METIESLRERLEVLQNQVHAFAKHTRATERRLHCWRRIAHGLMIVGLVSLPMASGTAQDESSEYRGIRERLAALEYKLQHITSGPDDVTITGANLRIVNGLNQTLSTNGLGNLIVGYNELRGDGNDVRTGSHNVVVGQFHNFSSSGGFVLGTTNTISSVFTTASGANNIASGGFATVTGGEFNTADGFLATVSGGLFNMASGDHASVSGGERNTASGTRSSVSGGFNRTAPDTFNWAAGPLFADN